MAERSERMTQTYLSLQEAAQLELLAARRREALARQALVDHDAEFGDKETTPELRASLDHQREALLVELDEATRWRKKCELDLEELKGAKL